MFMGNVSSIMVSRTGRIAGEAMGAAILMAMPCHAQAQQAADEPIIVTGERADRSIAQTSSSVLVIIDQDLERQPDTDRLDQLLGRAANVTLGSGGQGPTIRGLDTTGVLRDLPAFLGGTRPRTTLIVDGRPVSYNEFVFGAEPLWDVDKVEIFRSPQTTTQGRNSIAGAIFVETAAPEMAWHAGARLIGGNLGTRQISAMATGPVLSDQLAFRVTGDLRRGRTASTLISPIEAVDANSDDFEQLRFKLLATPSAVPDLRLEASYQASHSRAPQIEGIRPPFKDRRDPAATYGIFDISTHALTLRGKWTMDPATEAVATITAGQVDARRYAPPGLGEALNDVTDRNVEFVLRHQGKELDLLVGAAANRVRLQQAIDLSAIGLGTGTFRDLQQSEGIFGELKWQALDRLSVTIGGRYQHDRQHRAGGLLAAAGQLPVNFEERFSAFLPRLSVAFEAGAFATLGISAQRAAKPGGATLSPVTGMIDGFDAESLWAYEIFARGELDGPALTYAANLFLYDLRNAQRSVLRAIETPGGTFYFQEAGNVPRAYSQGAELQLAWAVRPDLSLRLSAGLLETRITRTPIDRDILAGSQFQRAPHFTGSAELSWRPAPSVELNFSYWRRSGYFSDDANTPSLRVGSAGALDARVGWQTGDLRLFAFARNVFDRFYLTALFDNGSLATAGDPREYGAGAEFRF